MTRLLLAVLATAAPGLAVAAPFDAGSSYAPVEQLVPGAYACRDEYGSFNFYFDLDAAGTYVPRNMAGDTVGRMTLMPGGEIAVDGGLFGDPTFDAMSTARASDGKPFIIIRIPFDGGVGGEWCVLQTD